MSHPQITASDVAETIAEQLDSLFDDELGRYYSAHSSGPDDVHVSFGSQKFLVTVDEVK